VTRAYLVDDSVATISNFFKGILSAFIAGIVVAFAIAVVFVGAPLFSALLLVITVIAIIFLIAFTIFTQIFKEKYPRK